MSVDALLEEFWSGDPPAAATASLQAYVSNLRRVLEPHRPPLITAALGAMGESNWYPVSYGVVDEGLVNVLGRALARLADPTQRALALSCLAAARYYDGIPQRRAAQSDEALTLARGLTDDLACARAAPAAMALRTPDYPMQCHLYIPNPQQSCFRSTGQPCCGVREAQSTQRSPLRGTWNTWR